MPGLTNLFNGSPIISAQPCEPTLPRTVLPSPECPACSIQREKSISRLVQGKTRQRKEPETVAEQGLGWQKELEEGQG